MNKNEFILLEKIATGLKVNRQKYVTADSLSSEIGILPERIQDICASFNPLVTIDFSFNLKDLLPEIEKVLQAKEKRIIKKTIAIKKDVSNYQRLIDFVYDKMTFQGMLDKSIILEDRDLREIRTIASDELKLRRSLKKKK